MIKTILLDTEKSDLTELEVLLKNYMDIQIIGKFTNPSKVLVEIKKLKPQAIFLDINMAKFSQIDFINSIREITPDIDIIFATADKNYAVEAFELGVLDYLLKPITQERLNITAERLTKKNNGKQSKCEKILKIKCLGSFQIGWQDEEPIRWRSEKTKELFTFLLQNKGLEISRDKIIDNIWSGWDVDKAIHQLHNAIHYIRKSLKEYEIDRTQISINGVYCLKVGDVGVDIDLDHFNKGILKIKNNKDDLTIKQLEDIVNIYSGEYFAAEDWIWADFEREKLLQKYNDAVVYLCEKYIEKKKYEKAEEYLMDIYNENPFNDIVTELILKIYKITNNKTKAVIHFKEYTEFLKENLGIGPANSIESIYMSAIHN